MLWTGGYIPNQNLGKFLRGTEKLWNYLLTLHYEDVADFTQSWSSNKKSVHSIFVLTLGVKKDQNWMTEVGRLAHCIC